MCDDSYSYNLWDGFKNMACVCDGGYGVNDKEEVIVIVIVCV